MVLLRCPECGHMAESPAGGVATCGQCGFSAPLDLPAPEADALAVPPGEVPSPDAPPPPASPEAGTAAWEPSAPEPRLQSPAPAPWAYLLGVVGFLTFWLAAFVLPFLLGAGAIALGIWARLKGRPDRRAVPAIALGASAILAAAIFLAV